MIASPTAASAAATAITKNTKTCPAMPRLCARATNVRLTALSISSTHMKITIALRRTSTPATPSVKSTAEIASAGLRSTLELPLRQHDGAYDGGEEQDARDLERNEIGVEQRVRHGADDALLLLQRGDGSGGQLDARGRRGLAEHAQLQQQRARQGRGGQESDGALDVGRSGAAQVQQHDHEQEQHHDRARVDQDLERGDELRVEQHEQRGQGKQGDDEPQRADDGVLARDAQQGAPHRDDAEKPKESQGAKSQVAIRLWGPTDPTGWTRDASAPSAARGRRRNGRGSTPSSRSAPLHGSPLPGTLPGSSRRRCSGTRRSRRSADSGGPLHPRPARA